MKKLIFILLLTNIFSFTRITGVFDKWHVLSGHITPENHLLIFSSNNSNYTGLYKYEMDTNSIKYTKGYKLELQPFPENSSETIDDFYININYINPTSIKIIVYNEKYLSTFIYRVDSRYYHISMEEIGPNELAIFYNSRNTTLYNNTLRIAKLDIKNKKLNFTHSYSISGISKIANVNCVKTSNSNILCGLIEYGGINVFSEMYNYYLILLKDESDVDKIEISSNSGEKIELTMNGLFKYNFIRFVSLDDEKVVFCHYKYFFSSFFGEGISCGLAQVKNDSKIEILIKSQLIFKQMAEPNYLASNIFSIIKYDNNQVILTCTEFEYYESKNITRLTIYNNTFIRKYEFISHRQGRKNLHNYIQLLKNNDNNLIFLMIYNETGEFDELSYGTCDNFHKYLYNGEISRLFIYIYPGFFNDKDNDIVFISDKKEINSLVYGREEEIIKTGNIYNVNNISFHLNTKDYEETKRLGRYFNVSFRNTLSEKESETCILNITFEKCDKECEICYYEKCYDRNWNIIDRGLNKTKKFAKTVSAIIFIFIFSMIISILIVFVIRLKNPENIYLNNNNANNENAQNNAPLV